jgi:hypothetical protein
LYGTRTFITAFTKARRLVTLYACLLHCDSQLRYTRVLMSAEEQYAPASAAV